MPRKRIELEIGRRFDYLTIKGYAGTDTSCNALYECICDCGKIFTTRGVFIRTGRTRSCGCKMGLLIRQSLWKGFGLISQSLWRTIEKGAALRGLPVTISIQDAWVKFEAQNGKCALTGVDLKFPKTNKSYDGTASLDRINSNKGYVKGNIQWVHKVVNRMKWDLTTKDFLYWVKKLNDFSLTQTERTTSLSP